MTRQKRNMERILPKPNGRNWRKRSQRIRSDNESGRGNKHERSEERNQEYEKKKGSRRKQNTNEWLYGGEELAEELNEILNKIWNGEQKLPEEWKTGVVTPIHKKGDIHDAKNYRGITLMDTGYKIYAEIIRRNLEKEMKEKKLMSEIIENEKTQGEK